MSRIEKKHWRSVHPPSGSFIFNGVRKILHRTMCGLMWGEFANAKRKVTCKRCLKMLGNPLTLGEKK